MVNDTDIKLNCRECGKQFIFTEGEQEFYEQMGFSLPTRCRQCRANREKHIHQTICARCGIELPRNATVYCETCFRNSPSVALTCSQCGTVQERDTSVYCETCLKKVQVDAERKLEKLKKEASITQAKLELAEHQNEELEKSLYEARQYIAELGLKLTNLSQDLERVQQLAIASNWLRPLLDSIVERLQALEQLEHQTNTVIQEIQKKNGNTSVWEVVKRTLTPHRKAKPSVN